MSPRLVVTTLACCVLLLVGCAGGGAVATRYYLIDPGAAAPLPGTGEPVAVQILDVQVPQYLDRYQIATRTGSNQLRFSDTHQWGETLRKNLARTMALNLGTLLASVDIATPYTRSATRPEARVQVVIDEFEQHPDGRVHLAARWQVIGPADGPVLTRQVRLTSETSPAPGDYAGMVAQMEQLYGELARQVAISILAVSRGAAE